MFLFLLPPSEGKQTWWSNDPESTLISCKKPYDIAKNATEKDLKCTWSRYKEWIELNTLISQSSTLPAIERYTWVMFKALDYVWLSEDWKTYADTHICILSGMYGLVQPQSRIWNYKLPIWTIGLYEYWKEQSFTRKLVEYSIEKEATIIDLLPWSYKKMLDKNLIAKHAIPYIEVTFYHNKDGNIKKLTHGVKKVKWAWLHTICEKHAKHIQELWSVKDNKISILV